MKLLLKRLDILQTAIELDDSELINSQIAALSELLEKSSYSSTVQTDISRIVDNLKNQQNIEAVEGIKSFVFSCFGGDEEATSDNGLQQELNQLSAQFSEYVMQRDGIIRSSEYFVRDYTQHCGALLEELLKLQKNAAEQRLKAAEDEYSACASRLHRLLEQRSLMQELPNAEQNRHHDEMYREALILLCRKGYSANTAKALQTAYTVGHTEEINKIVENLRSKESAATKEEFDLLIEEVSVLIEKIKEELDNLQRNDTRRLLTALEDEQIRQDFFKEQNEVIKNKIASAEIELHV